VAELLITSGADVNKKNEFGKSPMDMAVNAKLQNIVNLLIEHEAEPSTLKSKEKTNETAKAPDISIHDATKEGNIEAVKQHLADGGDVNLTDNDGMTPLHFAAFKGHKEIVKVLIAEGADVSVSHDGYTPLHAAGNKEIAELLIAKGADVNAKAIDGETPLHEAAFRGYKEIAELLIAEGADMNAKMEDGDTPLDAAIFFKETANLLRKHGGKTGEELDAEGKEKTNETANPTAFTHMPKTDDEIKTPTISIWRDAEKGNIEAVKQHLDNGVDVDAKDNIGWTTLHFATVLDHKEIVELLIAAGADVNAKNKEGRTPLNWAINLEETEIADLLRKHGGKTREELKAEGK